MIRHILNDYNSTIPTLIEIPSKDKPYDFCAVFTLAMMLLGIALFVRWQRCLVLKKLNIFVAL